MRITEGQLRRIIREEARRIGSLNESVLSSGLFTPVTADDMQQHYFKTAANALGVPVSSLVATDSDQLYENGYEFRDVFIEERPLGRTGLIGTVEGMPAVSMNAGGINIIVVAKRGGARRR
jgi:hypothetical protein